LKLNFVLTHNQKPFLCLLLIPYLLPQNPSGSYWVIRKHKDAVPHFKFALANALFEQPDRASKREALMWCKIAARDGLSTAQKHLVFLAISGELQQIESPAFSLMQANAFTGLLPSIEPTLRSIGTLVGESGPTCFLARCYTGEEPYILEEQEKINAFLRIMGIRTMLDVNGDQDGLAVGTDTRSFMESGIRDSDVVLYFLTPKGLERSHERTSGFAMELVHIVDRFKQERRGRRDATFLIPVLMAGNDVSSVPVELRSLLFIEALDRATNKFDLMVFFKEMWPLFETRFFKNHPQLAKIKELLNQGALELNFSQEPDLKTSLRPLPKVVQLAVPQRVDFTKVDIDEIFDHLDESANKEIYDYLLELVSQEPDIELDVALMLSRFSTPEDFNAATRPLFKLFLKLRNAEKNE
jgi:hypothetical protein